MSYAGISTDYDWSAFTPVDSTGNNYDLFRSAYKNVRFNVQKTTQLQLTSMDVANLPGLSYRLYNDTSLWRALMAYNGLSDPISDISVGIVIDVPTKADLNAYFSKQTNQLQASITI